MILHSRPVRAIPEGTPRVILMTVKGAVADRGEEVLAEVRGEEAALWGRAR